MKTNKTICIKNLLTILFFILINAKVFPQGPNDYNLCVKNSVQTSPDVIEFDIWLEWTGTNSQKFQFFAGGLNFNYATMSNGGTITGTFVTGSADASLPAVQQTPTWNINPTSKQIRMLASIASSTVAISIPPPPGIRLGTFRMTNTVPFNSSTPNFAWSYAAPTSNTTQTKESFYINSSSVGTGFVDASPFPNHCPIQTIICMAPPCATANVGGPYMTCGDFQLNGSFANASSASYSTTGTGTFDPNNSTLDAIYHPSNADLLNGVTITFTAIGGPPFGCYGSCNPAVSSIPVTFTPIDDNNVCTTDDCNQSTGIVSHTAINFDDGNACTDDGCLPSTGIFHTPVNIDDNNACTTDACNSVSGSVTHTPVNIDDNNACTTDDCNSVNGSVTHTPAISITPNVTFLSSVCSNDGAISLSVSGGTPPYSYSWANGASTQSISNLSAGTYPVFVTDVNNCSGFTSIVMSTTSVSSGKTNVAIYIRDNILNGSLTGVRLWMSDSALSPSHVARDINNSLPDFHLPYSQTWVVMIDDIPAANFGHNVRWIFLQDGNLSNHIIQSGKKFPPTIWLGTTRKNFECTDFTVLGAESCVSVAPCGILPVAVYVAPTPDNCLHAVLISGGWDPKSNYSRYPDNLKRMYTILRNSGYAQNNIYTFYSDGSPLDLDNGDNDNSDLTGSDVTGAASKINISTQLQSLCSLLSSSTSKLFVYVTNHGDVGGDIMLWDFNNNGTKDPDESIYPSEMASYTNNCQVCRDFYVMDQCYSGAFIGPLTSSGHPNSAVYTGATATEVTWWAMYMDQWEQNFSCQSSMNAIHQPISNINSTPQSGEGTPGNGNDKLCSCCLYISVIPFNPPCNGGFGAFSFIPGGGDGPYDIQTNPCPPSYPCSFNNTYGFSTLSKYPPGTYVVTVTDANGNTATQSVTITEPSPVTVNASVTATACNPCTGQIVAFGLGGTPFNINLPHVPYNVSFTQLLGTSPNAFYSDGPLNNDPVYEYANNLCASEYIVTVTDANGCTATTSVTVEPIPNQAPCCVDAPDKMIAWWPFDETTGNIAAEIVGGNNGITGSNVSINVPGYVSNAIRINKLDPVTSLATANEVVTVLNRPELNFGYGDLTIDAWVYWYTTPGAGVPLIDKPHAYRLMIAGPGPGFHWHLGPTEPHCFTGGNPVLSLNQWHHIAGIVNQDYPVAGKTTLSYYVDGVVMTSPAFNHLFYLSSSDDIYIGGRVGWQNEYLFDGKIDEVEVFNRALSGAEITSIYNAGHYGKCKSPCTTPGSDIYMKDTPADAGVEPNPDNGPMWISQDIWNRNEYHSTAQLPNNNNLNGFETNENQNPEYYSTYPSNKNYIYVRVRNKGCDPTPGNEELKVYWSMAATGLNWDANNINNDWVNNIQTIIGCPPATLYGDEITNHFGNQPIIIPSLKPGETKVFEIPWNAPNPVNFGCFGAEKNHICFLARIEGDALSPGDHIQFTEGTSINPNVKNNNNIVWRNTALVDNFPYKMPIFISKQSNVTAFAIKFNTPIQEINNHYFDFGSIKVDLGNDIYSAWVANGMQGSGFTLNSGTSINLTSMNAYISGIQGFNNEMEKIKLEFNLQSALPDSARHKYNFDVVQIMHLQNGDSLVGGQRITLDISCPDPVINGVAVLCTGNNPELSVVDLNNRAVNYQWKLNNADIPGANSDTYVFSSPGNYSVELTDANGCMRSAEMEVTNPTPVSVVATVTSNYNGAQISCNGVADGIISVQGSGGDGQYNFSIDGGLTFVDDAISFSGMSAGIYNVVAQDEDGCIGQTSINILEPPVLLPSISSTDVSCNQISDGTATINVSGGNPPYSYLWSNSASTQSISGLTAGLYSVTITDVNGCTTTSATTVSSQNCSVTLNLKLFIQGYYIGTGLMNHPLYVTGLSTDPLDADIVTISAMNATSPYGLVEQQQGTLKTNGEVTVTFSQAVIPNNSYYLRISHRNSVETWSKSPVLLTPTTTYLFSTAATQAFGDNEILTFDNFGYAIYSGDINHDGAVDGSDFLELDPSIQNGDGGYVVGDLNGDGAVDGSDFLVLDPNIQNGVGASP